jgi:hypothetical protein
VNTRRAVVALAAVALGATALAATLVLRDRGGTQAASAPGAIQTRLVLAPRVANFADTVTARIEVVLDRSRVVPGSLRIASEFEPWTPVRRPSRTSRDEGATRYVETVFVLRCLTALCPPRRQSAAREFEPVRVTYTTTAGAPRSFQVRWPVLVVNSRIVPDDFQREDELARPWRADLVSLPPPTYRISPALLLGLLLAGAGAFALAGGVLAYAALPTRRRPPPEPILPPEPDLTPLERALALLENGLPSDRAGERRQALERLARELAAHDAGLAQEASTLAWAAATPPAEKARKVATRVRSLLDEKRADAPA